TGRRARSQPTIIRTKLELMSTPHLTHRIDEVPLPLCADYCLFNERWGLAPDLQSQRNRRIEAGYPAKLGEVDASAATKSINPRRSERIVRGVIQSKLIGKRRR